MSDTPPERNSNSKTNLIEVQHVGVTAKLQSPLKGLLLNYSSSTENESQHQVLYRGSHHSNTKYNKFANEAPADTTDTTTNTTTNTTTTEHSSKVLYEMKTVQDKKWKKTKLTPSKIEFQLYTNKNRKRLRKTKSAPTQAVKPKRNLFGRESKTKANVPLKTESSSLFRRLRQSFHDMTSSNNKIKAEVDKIFDDLPEPEVKIVTEEIRIGIYPFEHGCAEYLQTHDCPPHIMSLAIAKRTTDYATKFWAEFFGSLYIGVAFLVTFVLQSYRFVLYSLVNTLLVGVLHMTSDYLIKPLLTVAFNGFLQPPLVLCFNILSSLRDVLEPIADALNNFMKPVATVGRSLRLVHATYNKKNVDSGV